MIFCIKTPVIVAGAWVKDRWCRLARDYPLSPIELPTYRCACRAVSIHTPLAVNSRDAQRMLEVAYEDYVMAARSKGLNENQIVF